jgi:acyl dehydratase
MPIDRKFIGMVSEPRTAEIDKGMLRFFAQATGQSDPIYSDEAAARAAGHPALPAPPTYVVALAASAPPKRGNPMDMGFDLHRVLHGEQSFRYHRMLYAGDTVTLVTRTSDIYEKKGGALEFIVLDTSAVNQHGELCVEMRSVLVVKNT